MTPVVSVIMTAYNREKYIAAAIESVLASTLTDFELIIVDDGSKDNTVEIAKSYEEKDSRIKFFVNEKNLGDYNNRNKAASYACGKYIKYVDSDDLIYPHGLSVMVQGMEKFPEAGVGIISVRNQEENPFPFLLSPIQGYQYHFYISGLLDMGPLGIIYNTKKFKLTGGFSGKRYVGDIELNLKMVALWPVVILPSSLVFWRIHSEQEFKIEQGRTGFLISRLPIYTEAFNSPQCPISQKEANNILDYMRKQEARQVLKIAISKRKPQIALRIYNELSLRVKDVFNGIFFPTSKIKRQ